MATHNIATREEWLQQRLALLKAEKELTHRSDEVARQRLALPWVAVNKPYRFETDAGNVSLADLFKGHSQLLVYHMMFGPEYQAACPSCSSLADEFNGIFTHLENHDVKFWAISRAPVPRLQAFKQRMGWTFPWASSEGGDFNFDFNVSFTEDQQRQGSYEYNYLPGQAMPVGSSNEFVDKVAAKAGTDAASFMRQLPGMSAFVLDDGVVYHTYSAYARGLDSLWGLYQWLDRAPKGRNESEHWVRHHDRYDQR